jgi:hypothetical protein
MNVDYGVLLDDNTITGSITFATNFTVAVTSEPAQRAVGETDCVPVTVYQGPYAGVWGWDSAWRYIRTRNTAA